MQSICFNIYLKIITTLVSIMRQGRSPFFSIGMCLILLIWICIPIVNAGDPPGLRFIHVESNPSGASIYYDDVDTSYVTPDTFHRFDFGTAKIGVKLDGYLADEKIVHFEGNSGWIDVEFLLAPDSSIVFNLGDSLISSTTY